MQVSGSVGPGALTEEVIALWRLGTRPWNSAHAFG